MVRRAAAAGIGRAMRAGAVAGDRAKGWDEGEPTERKPNPTQSMYLGTVKIAIFKGRVKSRFSRGGEVAIFKWRVEIAIFTLPFVD